MPEWSSDFPHFLQFKSEFGNKEFMIWAIVSSWSCFCWLNRASPSLAAKNIINLISILTIRWRPCVESSFVLLGEGVCYDQCILLAKLLAFALLHFVLQGQICLLLQVSWLPTFAFQSPIVKVKVGQLCPTLCNPMDCIVYGILQARILEWVAFPFSRGSSQPRDQTQVSYIAGGFFTSWATREAPFQTFNRPQ